MYFSKSPEFFQFLKYLLPDQCQIAGNSVYFDRMFLMRLMPKIDRWCNFRVLDVTTVKELCKYGRKICIIVAPSPLEAKIWKNFTLTGGRNLEGGTSQRAYFRPFLPKFSNFFVLSGQYFKIFLKNVCFPLILNLFLHFCFFLLAFVVVSSLLAIFSFFLNCFLLLFSWNLGKACLSKILLYGRPLFSRYLSIVNPQNQTRLMDSKPFEPLYNGHLSIMNAFCSVLWVFIIEFLFFLDD